MVYHICTRIPIEYSISNSGDPYQTPRSVASDLGLHCLSMSHKKDARRIWVKLIKIVTGLKTITHEFLECKSYTN